ncbi:hypothetical protein M0R19_05305 [Candidatus Pacearchaeota archaeon]|jgi:hypothetical protein|nr:hypothetical protein [Candidatus Pacearchaeota archaeon]
MKVPCPNCDTLNNGCPLLCLVDVHVFKCSFCWQNYIATNLIWHDLSKVKVRKIMNTVL